MTFAAVHCIVVLMTNGLRPVNVMVTEGQRDRLKRAAAQYGQSVAPWLLYIALREAEGKLAGIGGKLETMVTPKRIDSGKKTEYYRVRMTVEQKRRIDARANHLGVPLSVWLLMLGLLEAEKG